MSYAPAIQNLLVGFTSLSFFLYGATCIFSQHMRLEFARYGLAKYRVLTGLLQLAGATGLALSFRVPVFGELASAGLALQMALGFGVRLKLRDGFWRSSPAFIYMLLCALVFIGY